MRRFCLSVLLLLAFLPAASSASQNVVLITLDGVRCQELFQGMDASIWQAKHPDQDIAQTDLYRQYWADTPEERRARLMPFFWNELMRKHGAVAGNRFQGSVMKLTNRHRFSYPGYSEILTGTARDKEIASNDKVQNSHPTVLEFLGNELDLPRGKVAAFACWEVMDYIVEQKRGSIFSNAGFEAYESADPVVQALSKAQFATPTPWDSVRHDLYTFRFAMDHLQRHRPRVLYISLGETDDWGHDNRYDRVLQSLKRTDDYLRELWTWLQSQDDYRNLTTLYIATDHGRGDNAYNWMHHNDKLDGAAFVWMAAAGTGIEARGELSSHEPISQNQIAATLAASMGFDFLGFNPDAGRPLNVFAKP